MSLTRYGIDILIQLAEDELDRVKHNEVVYSDNEEMAEDLQEILEELEDMKDSTPYL